jgi:hypothetical protein
MYPPTTQKSQSLKSVMQERWIQEDKGQFYSGFEINEILYLIW